MQTKKIESIAVVQPPHDLETETGGLVAWARALRVTTAREQQSAVDQLKAIKTVNSRVAAFFAPMKKRADEAKRAILDAERKLTVPLAEAERLAKDAVAVFQWEQDRKAELDRQKAQAEADERARREKAALEKRAAVVKSPEKAQALLDQAASIVAPVIAIETEKAEGMSTRELWKYRVVDVAIVPREWMIPNDAMLAGYARSTKGKVPVAGVEFYSESSVAIRVT